VYIAYVLSNMGVNQKKNSWSLVSNIISDIQRYYIYKCWWKGNRFRFLDRTRPLTLRLYPADLQNGRKVKYIPLKYSQNQGPVLSMTLHKKGGVPSLKWWHQDIFSLHRTPFVEDVSSGVISDLWAKGGLFRPGRLLACLLGVLYLPTPTLFLAPLC
jgi:hypothetical protein